MKRVRVPLLVVLSIVVVTAASTAFAGPLGTFEVSAGYAKSSTELGGSTESLGGGIGFGAAYWRSMSPMVSWGAEVSYDNLGKYEGSGDDPFVGYYTESFDTKILRVNPAIRLNLGAGIGPSFFAQGGVGLYKTSWKIRYEDSFSIVEGDDSYSKVGVNVGAGVGFPIGPMTRMTVAASYHAVPADENVEPVAENFNNIQLRAGVGFGL